MREGRNEEEGEGGDNMGFLLRRRRHPPRSPSSPSRRSPSPPPSSAREDRGKSKNKKSDIARAIRDKFSPSSSCWGNVTIRRIGRSSGGGGRAAGDGHDTTTSTTTATRIVSSSSASASSYICISINPADSDSGCGGKTEVVAAAGLRNLIERNDFFSEDCNPHRQ